jgi:hypothetical protein
MTASEIAESYNLGWSNTDELEELVRTHLEENTSSFREIDTGKGELRFVFMQF